MDSTIEERAAALLSAWIAERGTTPAKVAGELGLEPAVLERMVSGREPLELSRLERVLGVLGVGPGEFFGRLYGAGEGSRRPLQLPPPPFPPRRRRAPPPRPPAPTTAPRNRSPAARSRRWSPACAR